MDITANPLFRNYENKQLKIHHEEINRYLVENFGIAGLINTWTVKRILEYNGGQDKAKALAELFALETILQKQENSAHLEWINEHIRTNYKYPLTLAFKKNILYLVDDTTHPISEVQRFAIDSGQFSQQDCKDGVDEYNKILNLLGHSQDEERALIPSLNC